MSVKAKFDTARAELNAVLLERSTEIDLCCIGLLSDANLFLAGPPGVAKSVLCYTFAGWLGGKSWAGLMDRFTSPEDLFGPVKFSSLKKDIYERNETDTVLDAEVCFFDEIWKASNAINNKLLTVLNEKQYKNGSSTVQLPMKFAMSASNEYPQSSEVNALYDRFLLRHNVEPVAQSENKKRLMFAEDLTPVLSENISAKEVNEARGEAMALKFDNRAAKCAFEIAEKLERENIRIGDRRKRKTMDCLKAHAWLNGRSAVSTDDLELLSSCWWYTPEQIDTCEAVVCEIAKPSGLVAATSMAKAVEICKTVDTNDLQSAIETAKKLGEVGKELKELPEGAKRNEALKFVKEQLQIIHNASLDSGI